MIYATVAGENAAQLCQSISTILTRLCNVLWIENNVLTAPEHEPELVLWQNSGDLCMRAERSVLIFGEPLRHAERIEVPSNCVVIANIEDEAAACYAARRGLRLLDCGLSSKASLTFSSIGRDTGVISLQRGITTLQGVPIEPMEIPLGFEPKLHYPLLAAVGTLLLAGMSERIEQDSGDKIWM